jgi:hypothetical protein
MRDALFAFVVNAAWQSASIAGFGLLLARLTGGARQRFELLALTLVAAVGAPALTLLPRASRGAAEPIPAIDLAPLQTRGGGVIAILYFAGLAFVVLRFVAAAMYARRLASKSIPFRGRMRLSHAIDGPVTIGRTVLLPSSIAADRALLAAALAHEHAHVRRNDYLLHVALELLALPLYFHPMLLVLRRAIAEAREMACDEEAAGRRGRKEYAAALVKLAEVAADRRRMILGMAGTSIERRVRALLRASSGYTTRRTAQIALLVLPLVAAAACTRFNAAPAVEQATLCGHWSLIAEASDFRSVRRSGYDSFTQTIEQGPSRVTVRQQRIARGRTNLVAWTVITDGVARPISGIRGIRGTATWNEGKLRLQFVGPGAHRETVTAFIRDSRLVCEGKSDRGSYHTEFRRVDP